MMKEKWVTLFFRENSNKKDHLSQIKFALTWLNVSHHHYSLLFALIIIAEYGYEW